MVARDRDQPVDRFLRQNDGYDSVLERIARKDIRLPP
jgi:hypothetical protein